MTTRTRALLALLASLVLMLAACNGNGADDPADPADDGDDAPETADLGLDNPGTMVVGSDIDFPPFEFVEDGENQGFDIDLMEEIADRLGVGVDFVNTSFDTIFDQLAGGDFDAIISAITITEDRLQSIDFSEPYFAANQGIAVVEGSDVSGPDDLAGLDVAVQAGTTGEEYAQETFTDSNIISFPNTAAAFGALTSDQVDAVFIDLPVVGEREAEGDGVVLAAEVETDELYGIGVQQGNDALTDAINDALADIISDGTYESIYSEWFEGEVPERFQS